MVGMLPSFLSFPLLPDFIPHLPAIYVHVAFQDDENPGNSQDLSVFVQNLLDQMQGRFQQMSTTIISRIDDMGSRIDELEQSINELMQQAGIEDTGDAKKE
eukprot:c397_g1_i2.p2 GENE.c397_g1_i2~~c397_g1_i2.p2  ORF type:complete len:117 (+),score=21.05 c397_g1_i2:50-352(+)